MKMKKLSEKYGKFAAIFAVAFGAPVAGAAQQIDESYLDQVVAEAAESVATDTSSARPLIDPLEQAASAAATAAILQAKADAAVEAAEAAAEAARVAAEAAALAEAEAAEEAAALAAATKEAPQVVEIVSADGLVSLEGVIIRFDEKLITIDTSYGVVGIENDAIECLGAGCPPELLAAR